jgi:hypothetical protein
MWSVPIGFGGSDKYLEGKHRSNFYERARLTIAGLHKLATLSAAGGHVTCHSPINFCH